MNSGILKCNAEKIIELTIAAIHQLKYLFIFININLLQINSSNIGLNNTAYMYIIGVFTIVSGGALEWINSDDKLANTLKPMIEKQVE